jgi:hypothetical protein
MAKLTVVPQGNDGPMAVLVEDYLTACKTRGLSPNTLKNSYGYPLRKVLLPFCEREGITDAAGTYQPRPRPACRPPDGRGWRARRALPALRPRLHPRHQPLPRVGVEGGGAGPGEGSAPEAAEGLAAMVEEGRPTVPSEARSANCSIARSGRTRCGATPPREPGCWRWSARACGRADPG